MLSPYADAKTALLSFVHVCDNRCSQVIRTKLVFVRSQHVVFVVDHNRPIKNFVRLILIFCFHSVRLRLFFFFFHFVWLLLLFKQIRFEFQLRLEKPWNNFKTIIGIKSFEKRTIFFMLWKQQRKKLTKQCSLKWKWLCKKLHLN